jgi:hypothetical protein
MKRIFTLICLAVLIFTVTSGVLAEGTIGIDIIPGGSDMMGSGQIKENLDLSGLKYQTGKFTSYFVRIEGIVKDFKFGIDYGSGTDEFKSGDIILSNCKYNFNFEEYKFVARVINNERVKLDLLISELQIQLNSSGNYVNQNGIMLGSDVDWFISEKVSLDGYIGFSLFGATYEENGTIYDPAFLGSLKARLNYAVTEHLALSLGLRNTYSLVSNYTNNSGLWRGIGGFLIGARFTL